MALAPSPLECYEFKKRNRKLNKQSISICSLPYLKTYLQLCVVLINRSSWPILPSPAIFSSCMKLELTPCRCTPSSTLTSPALCMGSVSKAIEFGALKNVKRCRIAFHFLGQSSPCLFRKLEIKNSTTQLFVLRYP